MTSPTTGFYLDNYLFEYPTEFEVEEFDIDYTDRVASGKMVTDIIATKRKFYLEYADMSIADITALATIRAKRDFVPFTFKYLGKEETVSVWVHPITFSGERQNPESWKDFSIVLEEE